MFNYSEHNQWWVFTLLLSVHNPSVMAKVSAANGLVTNEFPMLAAFRPRIVTRLLPVHQNHETRQPYATMSRFLIQ